MITLLNATVHGAQVIEKHFTLDKSLAGNDHYHAMGPADVRTFRENCSLLTETTGSSRKHPIPAEADSRKHARRSLVVVSDLDEGEEITRTDLSIKRPGTGIAPEMFDVVVGRTARTAIAKDEILDWTMI